MRIGPKTCGDAQKKLKKNAPAPIPALELAVQQGGSGGRVCVRNRREYGLRCNVYRTYATRAGVLKRLYGESPARGSGLAQPMPYLFSGR